MPATCGIFWMKGFDCKARAAHLCYYCRAATLAYASFHVQKRTSRHILARQQRLRVVCEEPTTTAWAIIHAV